MTAMKINYQTIGAAAGGTGGDASPRFEMLGTAP